MYYRIFSKDQMREIEKVLVRERLVESFYRQKHLEEEILMEMFGREFVLQMRNQCTKFSQQPNATNEAGDKALVLHKSVHMTLMDGGPPCLDDQDGHEETLSVYEEGTKENTDTLLVDANDQTSSRSTEKENWKCQLCDVVTNSKMLLERHYMGKKHKKKEKAAQKSGITFPTSMKSVEENMEARHEEDLDRNGPSVEEKDEIIPGENALGTKRKIAPTEEEQGNETASASDQNKKPKQGGCERTSKFWCQVCKFGTMTKETMIIHRMGKDHMESMLMNGGAVIVETNEPVDVHYVEAGKLQKQVSSVKECALKTKENTDTPLVDGNDETYCNSTKKENWECQMCHVMANSKKALERHYSGKKHKKKEKKQESGIISPNIKESLGEKMEAQHKEDLDKVGNGPSVEEKDEIIPIEMLLGQSGIFLLRKKSKTMRLLQPVVRTKEQSSGNVKQRRSSGASVQVRDYDNPSDGDRAYGVDADEWGCCIVETNKPGDVHYVEAGKMQKLVRDHNPELLS